MKNLSKIVITIIVLFTGAQLIVGCDSMINNNNSDNEEFENKCMQDEQAELCNHKYALCIAASCDPSTMSDNKIECGQCDKTDGSCGYCYVFEGKSCSYNAPCSEVEPSGNIVYSTYSEELSNRFGFDAIVCEGGATIHAGCMDAPCTLTGESVFLTDTDGVVHEIQTAICTCNARQDAPKGTLGAQCDQSNCSAIWSTAIDHREGVLAVVPQCSDSN